MKKSKSHFQLEKLNPDSSLVGDLCQNENNPFINPNGTSYLLERLGVDITDRLSFLDESIFPIPKEGTVSKKTRSFRCGLYPVTNCI